MQKHVEAAHAGERRPIVDWRAAIIAGILAGFVFLLVNMWLSSKYLGNAWVPLQLPAAMVLGPKVLPPATGMETQAFGVGLPVHLILSVAFACLVAFCLHRWGILVGVIGGALFGLALYAINYYGLSGVFPWFGSMRSSLMAISHLVFGAVAGGVYELLERERFEHVAPMTRGHA
jgi:hypothetical protein